VNCHVDSNLAEIWAKVAEGFKEASGLVGLEGWFGIEVYFACDGLAFRLNDLD
jgi:hypothetical protein